VKRILSFTLGALAYLLYEYLPKMYALLGDLDPVCERLATYSLRTIKEHLSFRPMLSDKAEILFPGNAYVEEGRFAWMLKFSI